MNIKPDATIKQGRAVMEKGKVYDVPDGMGIFFTSMGWAKQVNEQGEKIDPALFGQLDAPERRGDDLQINKATLGQKGRVNG